jgi:hypothetical protein
MRYLKWSKAEGNGWALSFGSLGRFALFNAGTDEQESSEATNRDSNYDTGNKA